MLQHEDLARQRLAGWNGEATMLDLGRAIMDGSNEVVHLRDVRVRWVIRNHGYPKNPDHSV